MRLSAAAVLSVCAGMSVPVLAQPASIMGLGDLAGGSGSSTALGVSPDGTKVVGSASGPNGEEAYYWSAETGMIGLGIPLDWFLEYSPDLTSFASAATAVSDNGVVTGYVVENENGNLKAFRWTAAGGMENISGGGLDFNAGRAITIDGSFIAGETYPGGAVGGQWSRATGWLPIDESGIQTLAWGLSYDGAFIAGNYGAFPSLAYRWSQEEQQLTLLGDIPGGIGDNGANAISGDGRVVVGFASDNPFFQDKFQAMRWTAADGMVGLGRLPGTRLSSAFGASADGSSVVGYAFNSGSAASQKAFLWTPGGGLQDLKALLAAGGADVSAWQNLEIGYGVSGDGRAIVGSGLHAGFRREAYIARLGPVCRADLNGDGIVDFADYLEFLNFYDASDLRVDFNGDGIIDFADYLEFLNLYDAGC